MKFKIYCDTHIGSPIEMLLDEVIDEPIHENTLFLGDIVDGANCKKDEVLKYRVLLKTLQGRHSGNILVGNHERDGVMDEVVVKVTERGEKIIFAHGDMQANPKKWAEYRMKPWGAGLFKRKVIIPFIREAEEIINRKPKQEFLDRVIALCDRHNANTYVCGHFHVKETITLRHNGARIILLPRGCTVLDL